MKQAVLAMRFLSRSSAKKALPSHASDSCGELFSQTANRTLKFGRGFCTHSRQDLDALVKQKALSSTAQRPRAAFSEGSPALFGKFLVRSYVNPAERRRRMNALRMEQSDPDEEARRIDMDPAKMLDKGTPGTHQAIIKDVMPVGYFVNMPSGREGYLPATDLGFTGGLAVLERLFKVGQEITVRITSTGGGRDILSIKKPEFAPDPDQFRIGANLRSNR